MNLHRWRRFRDSGLRPCWRSSFLWVAAVTRLLAATRLARALTPGSARAFMAIAPAALMPFIPTPILPSHAPAWTVHLQRRILAFEVGISRRVLFHPRREKTEVDEVRWSFRSGGHGVHVLHRQKKSTTAMRRIRSYASVNSDR
jgi:hypothetical protein